jgi:O-antigen/teichoic acid export membrane protein
MENHFFDFVPDMQTIKRSSLNSVLIQGLIKMKGIITMPIFTYFMMPKEMGIYNIISITSALLSPLFTLNLPDASVLFLAREKSSEKIRVMYLTVINVVFLTCLLLTILALAFIVLFKNELLTYAIWVGIALYAAIFYKQPEFILVTYQKTSILLRNVLIRDVGSTLCAVGLVVLGLSYKGILIAGAVFMIIMGFFLFKIIFSHFSYSFLINRSYLKSFLKLAIPLLPVFFFSWIIQSSGSYFLLHFKGEDMVGKYSVIFGLCSFILILTSTLNFFWFPMSARLWVENREKYRTAFSTMFLLFSCVLFAIVLFFELDSQWIMRLLARRVDYQEAFSIMGIIAFAFAMQVMITLLTAPLYSNKNPQLIFLSYLIGGVVNVVLNVILVPKIGLMGAAIATAVSYFLIVMMMSLFNYGAAKFYFADARMLLLCLVFGGSWIGAVSIRSHLSLFQLGIINIFLFLAIASLIYFKLLKEKEKEFVFAFLKSILPGNKSFGNG